MKQNICTYFKIFRPAGVIFNIQTGEVEAFPRINGTYEVERYLPPAAVVANAQAFVGPA